MNHTMSELSLLKIVPKSQLFLKCLKFQSDDVILMESAVNINEHDDIFDDKASLRQKISTEIMQVRPTHLNR